MFDISYDFTALDIMLLVAGAVFVVLIIVAKVLFNRSRESEIDKKFIQERWKKIEELYAYGKEMNYKLAIIEADKILEFVLNEYSFPGPTMSEKLKLATYKYPALKDVRWAHHVRNKVVHEARYVVTPGETKKVLKVYKIALKSMNCI